MSNPRILIFDRPSPSGDRLADHLEGAGFRVDRASDPAAAGEVLREASVDVLLGELERAGADVIRAALSATDGPEVVLFEDFLAVEESLVALRSAVFDTLARPVSAEEVCRVVERALEHRSLVAENRRLRGVVGERFELGSMVTRDPRLGRLFDTVAAVADSSAPILLTGESGTGKTVLARAIHDRSCRSRGPFVSVNCGAIPAGLLESELFGHAKGSFTGAIKDRQGKFEAAGGGTIFLDEIGTASPELQVKLLRVLEQGRFERVGEERTRTSDARVIAATNSDLALEVELGRFRADLYYRVHVVGLEVPPLRQRTGDIPLLADLFLARFAERHRRPGLELDARARAALVAHPWPGNVRELENTLERAVLLATGEHVGVHDLWPADAERDQVREAAPSSEAGPPLLVDLPLGPLKEVLAVPERWLILRVLRRHAGNRKETAATLGINRTTLFNKMRKYDLLSFPSDACGETMDDAVRSTPEPKVSPRDVG